MGALTLSQDHLEAQVSAMLQQNISGKCDCVLMFMADLAVISGN